MTEVEQLRAELDEARSRLRLLQSLLDHAPAFIAHITLDGHFLFLNRTDAKFESMMATSTIYDWSAPADRDAIRAVIDQVVATGQQADYESKAGPPEGPHRPYLTRAAPVMRDGVVESIVLIATDVTRLKQTETELLQSQASLQHVLRVTGTGTWWWDIDRSVGSRDEQTARLFGVDVSHANRAELTEFVHPEDRQRVNDAFLAAVADKTTALLEHRLIRADGSVRWISASAAVIDGPFGPRMLGGVRDVTERKLLEGRLAQAQKLESVGRLAGGIAHDFNNMLTVITSNTDRLLRKEPESSPIHRDLMAIRAAAERSTALTSQLLVFARQQMSRPDVVLLDNVIRSAEESIRRTVGRHAVLATQLAATRPVRIDVGQFEQVLTNLAANARDAMPEGGRFQISTTDVTLAAADLAAYPGILPGPFVKLEVSDTGIGIGAADLVHIFEPFFTTKEQGKGTGLGLATCYGIVAQNGGFMTVTSTPGHGATFEVFLPAAAV